MKVKKDYIPPVMTCMKVELEQGFMSASIVDNDGTGVAVEASSQAYESLDSNHWGPDGKENPNSAITWE